MKAKADIQQEMLPTNTFESGYFIWLDLNRDISWDSLSRLQILPRLPVQGERSDEASNAVLESARTIASVANSVINRVKHGTIFIGTSMHQSIKNASDDYSSKVLHPIELQWYKDRSTCEDIIAKSKNFNLFYLIMNFLYFKFTFLSQYVQFSKKF